MLVDLATAKEEFQTLALNAKFQQAIKLLLRLRKNVDLQPEDAGWVLWNLCDLHALTMDADTQLAYQTEFFAYARQNFPERIHWVVSDSTQANSLIRNGYGDFWLTCYRYANDTAPRIAENRRVRFEAHRSTARALIILHQYTHAEFALERLADLLLEDPQWHHRDFARITYLTYLLNLYAATEQSENVDSVEQQIASELGDWLERYGNSEAIQHPMPLLGSWEYVNDDWTSSTALSVCVHDVACACAAAGRYATAERFFHIQRDRFGARSLSAYGESMFLLSCWHNRYDKEEVTKLFEQSKHVDLEQIERFAPVVASVVKWVRQYANERTL